MVKVDPRVRTATHQGNFIANLREAEARQLSDYDIHAQVAYNIFELKGIDKYTKAQLLLESIPDLGLMFHLLRLMNKEQLIKNKPYQETLEIMMKLMQKTETFYDVSFHT